MTFPFEKHDVRETPPNDSVSMNSVNYYDTLGISFLASKHEIRQAYLSLRNTYSKQSCAVYSLLSEEEASLVLSKIEEAFRVLDNDILRKKHDLELGLSKQEECTIMPSIPTVTVSSVESASSVSEVTPLVTPSSFVPSARQAADVFYCSKSKDEQMQQKVRELLDASDIGDGTTYKNLRELLGVSLDEIQDKTKISLEYVKCIENNCFERLPQVIFVKGFLRGYFKYLNIPSFENLVAAFITRFEDWQKSKHRF